MAPMAENPSEKPVRAAEEEIVPAAESVLDGTAERAGVPGVLFVCVRNGGKSQMAAGLMRRELAEAGAEGSILVSSAGTDPGSSINTLSADVLHDLGADITGETPTPVTPEAMREAGLVVVIGAEAQVDPPAGVTVERWETDEPSDRGIEGRERMELVRDDIHAHVRELKNRLLS